ncbi:MAG: hypothetical protein WAT93_10115 [Pontixanthobacter sp.]
MTKFTDTTEADAVNELMRPAKAIVRILSDPRATNEARAQANWLLQGA